MTHATTAYLSFIAIALLAALIPMRKKIFPAFLVDTIAISFMSTTDYAVIPLADYTASVPLSLLAITGQIIIHTQKEVLLVPELQDVITTLAIVTPPTKLQRFVPINLERPGPGDPRKGRLYNTVKTIQWNDKWPRIAEVKWGPPNSDDITPAYTGGENGTVLPKWQK